MHKLKQLITMALGLIILSGFSFKTQNTNQAIASENNRVAEIGDKEEGYYLGDDCPLPSGFSKASGIYYVGEKEHILETISYKVNEKNLVVEAPYVLPGIQTVLPGEKDGFYNEYKTKDEDKTFTWYAWDEIKLHPDKYQLHVFKSEISVEAVIDGKKADITKSVQFNAIEQKDDVMCLQNLKLTFPSNIEEYEYLSIDFGPMSFLWFVDIFKRDIDWYQEKYCVLEKEESPSLSATIVDSVNISGERILLPEYSSWYELQKNSNESNSFIKRETAINKAKELIKSSIMEEEGTIKSKERVQFDSFLIYGDHAGNEFEFEDADIKSEIPGELVYKKETFKLVASYRMEQSKPRIKEVVAFLKDDDSINSYISEQAEILVKECSVYEKDKLVQPYPGEESLLFNGYQGIKGIKLESEDEFSYKELKVGSVVFQSKTTKKDGRDIEPGSIIYTPNKICNGKSYDYGFYINTNYEKVDYKKYLSEGSTERFKNYIATAIDSEKEEEFIFSKEDETQSVTFLSNDKLFVRIKKDGELIKEDTTYSTSTVDAKGKITTDLNPLTISFNEGGKYEIDLCPRGGLTKTIKLMIHDYNDINVYDIVANNLEMTFSITYPGQEDDVSLVIYKNENAGKTDYDGSTKLVSQLMKEEDLKNWQKLEKDDKNTAISPSNLEYYFINTSGNHNYAYYIEIGKEELRRGFILYWKWTEPYADIMEITIDDWPENVGWLTHYKIEYRCKTKEIPVPESKVHTCTVSRDGIVKVDVDGEVGTITALYPGEVELFFECPGGGKETIKLAITDDAKYQKKIEVSTHQINIKEGNKIDFTATAEPEDYMDQTKLIFEVKDPSIAKYENGKIYGLKEGATTLEISYDGEPSLKQTVSIQVSKSGGGDDPGPGPTPTPTPDDPSNDNTKAIIILSVVGGVGAIAIGVFIFLIIKAKKTGSLKK